MRLPVVRRRAARPAPAARAGFTLIELLIVVVIIGILAAIAIPQFANTRGKANIAKVKSDLHSVSVAEEGYFYEHSAYTTSLAALGVEISQGVTMEIVEATPNGWSATAVHPSAVPVTCALFYGSAAPVPPATTEGVIACR